MTDACCSCEAIREIIKEEFDRAVGELKATRPSAKKRTLSKWQLFLKECIPTKQNLPFRERIKACSVEYKKR